MIRCEFCGSELPANAQFCGNCGHKINDRYATVTDISNALESGIPEPQTPPLFSSPLHPDIRDSRTGWQTTDSTLQTTWSVENLERENPQFTRRNTDENEAVIPDFLLPGMMAMQGQMPSPIQTPMVQGTPQFGGVPSVQGTPMAPGNVPQSIPDPAHGAASSVSSSAPQEAQNIPIHHQQVQQPAYRPPSHVYKPVHNPQPTPPPHEVEHKHHHRHHTGPLHEHKPHSTRLQHTSAMTSRAGVGVVSKWIIIAVITLVIIGSSSIFLAHALMPTPPSPVLTITGSNSVRVGGILYLHGQGFQPGDSVTLTIDNGLPVSLASQQATQVADSNTHVAGLSQMNIAGALQLRSADNKNITVSSTGTFDANVTVPSGLPTGTHTIHATDNQSSQSASMQFTISSPQLVVDPTALNFGSVEVGRTVKLLVTLSNQDGASLNWTATVEGLNTNWLTLSKNSGVSGTNGSSDPIIVTANTNGLLVGSHTATLRFHTDNGDVQATVRINAISVGQSGQQAILNVSQQNLDFGQLQAGQQAQQNISIANLGNLPLQWQASSDAGSTSWLSLTMSKGTVQPGAVPQLVQVKVDTTSLLAGSYSGTIHITSNGGNAQVGVTLVVTGSTVTPTPTITPTQSSTPTQVPTTPTQTSPSVLAVDATGNCPADPNGNYKCTDTLTITGSQGSIDWNVKAEADLPGTTFSPPNGTLVAGQSPPLSVTVTIPASDCPKYSGGHYDYSWTGSHTARVTFTCLSPSPTTQPPSPTSVPTQPPPPSPTPTPQITVTPQKIDQNTCSQNSDRTYTCTVTVGETSPGNLSWSTTVGIGGTGTSINPQSGQLSASNPQQSVRISSIPCQNGSFSFIDQNNNTVNVVWSCTLPTQTPTQTQPPPPPTLTVNPTSLSDLSGSPCKPAPNGGIWSCTVTVMETSNSQGNLTWSVSSSLSGVTFSSSGSTLSPGQSVPVTISNIPCVSSGTFTFSGGANPVVVTWGCGS